MAHKPYTVPDEFKALDTFRCAECGEEVKLDNNVTFRKNYDGSRICGTCWFVVYGQRCMEGDGATVEIRKETVPLPIPRRGQLRFLIGLQRSGKSTYADKWVLSPVRRKDAEEVEYPRVVVCSDNIRLAVTGERYNRHAEPTVFMVKDYMVEALLSRGHDVLVDGTHTTKTSIRRNFEIDIDAQWTLINTDVEVCKRRAAETGQVDLVPVLDRTNRQLQSLLAEGISQVCEKIREEVRARWPDVLHR